MGTGIVGALLLLRQDGIIQGQLDAMNASNLSDRPWLGANAIAMQPPDTKETNGTITFINGGRGAARILSFEVDEEVDWVFPAPSYIFKSGREVAVPGVTMNQLLTANPFKKSDVDLVKSGAEHAYVFGRISYQDVDRTEVYTTKLCWVYDHVRNTWEYCDQYNDAN